ncbi:MAG: alpha/beta hydrolase [Gordonia sp. (in: high G+C Gram-positive bacteria)]
MSNQPHSRAPIVLIHGLRVSGATMHRIAAAIDDREVICPDMPGHGTRRDEIFTLESAVAAVADTIEQLGRPALVAGMSMGGYVAMATAAAHPDSVAELVVLCATAQPTPTSVAPFRIFGTISGLLPAQAAQLSRWLTRVVVGQRVSADMEAGGLALHSIGDVVDELSAFDALDALARYAGRTLFVNGAWDQFRINERRFVRTAAHGELIVIPRATHLFPLIQPQLAAQLITEFADRDRNLPAHPNRPERLTPHAL